MTTSRRNIFFSILVLICTSILAFLALIQPWSLRQEELPLEVGNVAPQDLRAPSDFQYVSEVLTEQARAAAERAIAPVYRAPDPSIGRTQTDLLTNYLNQISDIRDEESEDTFEEKLNDLISLQDVTLTSDSASLILNMSSTRWDLVFSEAVSLLGRTMRGAVRTEDLDSIRENLGTSVSYTLSVPESSLVVDLVSPLIAANSFYSPELTEGARLAARESVDPITKSYLQGQAIVLRGQLITDVIFEALTAAGLIQPEKPINEYLGAATIVSILFIITILYFKRRQTEFPIDLRGYLLLAGLFLIVLFSARIVILNRTLFPYLFPVAAFALFVSALYGMERGMFFGLLISITIPFDMPESQALIPYYLLTSLFGVLALGQARRIMSFLYAAIAIAAAGIATLTAFRLAVTETDLIGIATLFGAAAIYGLASSAIVLPLQYVLAQFLGVTTPLQLLDISRPDSELLKYFLQRAPGTYQHSLQVANLAEQAAERIGADPLLTRVGALIHDIGKTANPLFFVENQPPDQIDSHDDLPPEESAHEIIRHVTDGLTLAKKYRLPRRLCDFISEHHGTQITRYQYNRALQATKGDETKVDESRFRYPGPPPRSKETALLMIADGVEARTRAEKPSNDEALRSIVMDVIQTRQKNGQLNNTALTQHDLIEIAESFIATLQVTYHPRLEYPQRPNKTGSQSSKERKKS